MPRKKKDKSAETAEAVESASPAASAKGIKLDADEVAAIEQALRDIFLGRTSPYAVGAGCAQVWRAVHPRANFALEPWAMFAGEQL